MAEFDVIATAVVGNSGPDLGGASISFPSTPAAGNLLLLICGSRTNSAAEINPPSGWTMIASGDRAANASRGVAILGKIADGSETGATFSNMTPNASGAPEATIYAELAYSRSGLPNLLASDATGFDDDTTPTFGTISLAPGPDSLILAIQWKSAATPDPGPQTLTGMTLLDDSGYAFLGNRHRLTAWYEVSGAGTHGGGTLSAATDGTEDGVLILWALEGGTAPPIVGPLPEYIPPPPADALLEIWTDEDGGAEWGAAVWGTDVWGEGGWRDITMLGVECTIRWGTLDPDAGILADQSAADWSVTLYDPDRVLDPANTDSPYYPDVGPGLPIRLSHRGVVVHTGYVTTISYSYANESGTIRGTDNIALMAQAMVPTDVTMGDNMKERARDAIAAASLAINTSSNPGDYSIPPQVDEEHDVWWWTREAARDRHVIAYIDRDNVLTWRTWSGPLRRGRVIDASVTEDLIVAADDADRLSAVRVIDDDGVTVVERAVTPTPAYGRRLHDRTIPTTDAASWAMAVLDDRTNAGLRWRPGRIRAATADDVEAIATLDVNEEVSLSIAGVIEATARVLGGRMRVTWAAMDNPIWDFWLALSTPRSIALIDDETADALVSDDDMTEFLEAG